ncbi:DUF418 domain-containing protein [Streptomyces chengbuensis]|uniref:DUF418 domain-containing protein n=1 Tax=Streptomyces TaxID=1883 RepID=UPI0025B55A34|nr:DUF418 domain-containing protein [Streptomyces sp. HUAS CB01]WJY52653.1 DUF418 domain-containing protein [Streptomyces sp. HUAS CB01]
MTVETTTAGPVRRGAVRGDERALAPDVARGLMLLLIVLSNTAYHLWAARRGPSGWHPVDGSRLDQAVQFTMIVVLDMRVYPLFAFLFGYGMTQLFLRQTAAGTTERDAAAILRRRSLWLVALGLAHAILLMAGDILGYYGMLSLLLGRLFLRRSDRALTWWIRIAAVQLVLVTAGPALFAVLDGGLGAIGDPGAEPGYVAYASGEENWLEAVGTRLSTGLLLTFGAAPLSLVAGGYVIFLLGFWAARRRVLEEPGSHLPLLRRTAVVGIAVGWLGALPAALAHVGVLRVPDAAQSESGALTALRDVTGNVAGLGYVAAIALFAHWWASRPQRGGLPVVPALAAVGKRSLSCYLAHSLLFAPVLAAWGLGLGEHLGSASMALFGTAVWLVTVAGAYALERRGRRGPAETLLRRLMYGRAA